MKIYRKVISSSVLGATYTYNGMKFDIYQMDEIQKGLKSGVDVSMYADPKFDSYQMEELRKALQKGIDVSMYADPKFDAYEMEEIRKCLEKGIDISKFINIEDYWDRRAAMLSLVYAKLNRPQYSPEVKKELNRILHHNEDNGWKCIDAVYDNVYDKFYALMESIFLSDCHMICEVDGDNYKVVKKFNGRGINIDLVKKLGLDNPDHKPIKAKDPQASHARKIQKCRKQLKYMIDEAVDDYLDIDESQQSKLLDAWFEKVIKEDPELRTLPYWYDEGEAQYAVEEGKLDRDEYELMRQDGFPGGYWWEDACSEVGIDLDTYR